MPESPSPPPRRLRNLCAALVPIAGLFTCAGAFAQTDGSRTFEVPADIDRPCLSYTTSDGPRLLMPHALVARVASQASMYDAAVRTADPVAREAARIDLIQASRAAMLLAAQRPTLDADGCRNVDTGARGMSGSSEQI